MNIREKCEKCKNYYGQNELYFAKNKSEHLKKCGFKIKCDNCTEFTTTSLSLSECEEKLKNIKLKSAIVACKDIFGKVKFILTIVVVAFLAFFSDLLI